MQSNNQSPYPEDQVVAKVQGLILGSAIGDALGHRLSLLTPQQIKNLKTTSLSYHDNLIAEKYGDKFQSSHWTDDTDQLLCILDSLLQTKQLHPLEVAQRLHSWSKNRPIGIGYTTLRVLRHPEYLTDPSNCAKQLWQSSNQENASNGGVMRTALVGVWNYTSPEVVRKNAENLCKLTHYDPRCVGSCVVVSLAISYLLQGLNPVQFMDKLQQIGGSYHPEVAKYVDKAGDTLESLELEQPESWGYTLNTMAVGLWSLLQASSYTEGIAAIIHKGGDSDTNAAVAGALLGAKLGVSAIPQDLIRELKGAELLLEKTNQLLMLNLT